MKRFVRDDPIAWVVVLFIATLVAEQTGPNVAVVYFTALGVAAIALVYIVVPEWRPGRADRGRDKRSERRAR